MGCSVFTGEVTLSVLLDIADTLRVSMAPNRKLHAHAYFGFSVFDALRNYYNYIGSGIIIIILVAAWPLDLIQVVDDILITS